MNVIETIRTAWGENGRFEAAISILPDDDPPRPNDCECEPEFFQARSGAHLRTEAAATFGHAPWDRQEPTDRALRVIQCLASGEVVKDNDGTWYYGVAEYRHSGSAFTLCGSLRHMRFPDQRWDVIGLCGWIKITRKNRIDWGIHGRKGVDELARKNAEGCLEEWTAYVNGWYARHYVATAHSYQINGLHKFSGNSPRCGQGGCRDQPDIEEKPGCRGCPEPGKRAQLID